MRAPVFALLALLCLPLQADEQSELVRAVKLFRSGDARSREQGSRLAEHALRQALAPLLEAMKDPDPEVRRRAREAILALVPYHDRAVETKEQQQVRLLNANRLALQGLQIQLRVLRAKLVPVARLRPPQVKITSNNRPVAVLAEKEKKGRVALAGFGVTGNLIRVLNVASGIRITAVAPRSTAQKAGLLAGDTILWINGKELTGYGRILDALDPRRGWSGAKLKVQRNVRLLELRIR